MRVVLARGGMRPRVLAEVSRPDLNDPATLALLVGIDTSNAQVLGLLADTLDEAELAEVASALDLGPDGAA